MKPRLTDQVLEGILTATVAVLAGEFDDEESFEAVTLANRWAHEMVRWRDEKRCRTKA